MATFVEFESLSEAISTKLIQATTDTFKVYFTNTAPSAAADAVLGDLPAEIANGNGYTTGGLTADITASRSGNTTTWSLASPVVLTATGAVGPFQYWVIYSDTSAAANLVGYLDHGSAVTMANTDTYTIPAGAILTVN
jgi:hypothetical protein